MQEKRRWCYNLSIAVDVKWFRKTIGATGTVRGVESTSRAVRVDTSIWSSAIQTYASLTTSKFMNSNPYQATPHHSAILRDKVPVVSPWICVALLVYGIIFGWLNLTPFLTRPMAIWGWQNWCFGFAPSAYLLIAAVMSVLCERIGSRSAHFLIPIVLSPLIAVTLLILFATYIDFPNVLAGKYAWTQILHSIALLSLCPVVWYYQAVTIRRAWKQLNNGITPTG